MADRSHGHRAAGLLAERGTRVLYIISGQPRTEVLEVRMDPESKSVPKPRRHRSKVESPPVSDESSYSRATRALQRAAEVVEAGGFPAADLSAGVRPNVAELREALRRNAALGYAEAVWQTEAEELIDAN